MDKSSEDFKKSKEEESEKLDEYLEDEDKVVGDSVDLAQANAGGIKTTINDYADQYGLKVSEEIVDPWKDGATAISDYDEKFGDSASTTTDKLGEMNDKAQELATTMQEISEDETIAIGGENKKFAEATKKTTSKENADTSGGDKKNNNKTQNEQKPSLTEGSYVEVKAGTKWYADSYGGGASGNAKSGTIKHVNKNGSHAYNIDGLGWIKKTDIKGYKVGTTGVKNNQLAWIDEMGLEELVMHAGPNGRLQYLTKGSTVIPHDITENLMKLGQLDPSTVLDQNRPAIAPSKSVVNTEINLDCSVAELIHIEHCDQNTLPDVEKMVNKAFEKHMQNVNNSIKRFSR